MLQPTRVCWRRWLKLRRARIPQNDATPEPPTRRHVVPDAKSLPDAKTWDALASLGASLRASSSSEQALRLSPDIATRTKQHTKLLLEKQESSRQAYTDAHKKVSEYTAAIMSDKQQMMTKLQADTLARLREQSSRLRAQYRALF